MNYFKISLTHENYARIGIVQWDAIYWVVNIRCSVVALNLPTT